MDASSPPPLPFPPEPHNPTRSALIFAIISGAVMFIMLLYTLVNQLFHENCFRRLVGLPPLPPPPPPPPPPRRLPQRPTRTQRRRILRSIPVLSFDAQHSNPSTECSICLTEFVGGDGIRILPQCGHGFHVVCIDMWLNSRFSCPNCRQDLTAEQLPQP